MIALKRAYDPVSNADGTRLLVERLWPRGVSKAKLRIDSWLKEVGPSTDLRKWFSHDPKRGRVPSPYFASLPHARGVAADPCGGSSRDGPIVYSSHDTEHNMRLHCRSSCEGSFATARGDPRDESFWRPAPRLTFTVASAASAVPTRPHGVGAAAPFA